MLLGIHISGSYLVLNMHRRLTQTSRIVSYIESDRHLLPAI